MATRTIPFNARINGRDTRVFYSSTTPFPTVQEGEWGYLLDTQQEGVYLNGAWHFYPSAPQLLRDIRTLLEADPPAAPVYDEADPLIARLVQREPLPVRARLWVSQPAQAPYGATSGAHDANDALGDKVYFTTSVEGEPLPLIGRIVGLSVIDPDDDTLAATLHVFSDDFTAAASDAAFTISAGDARNWVDSFLVSPTTDIGGAKVFKATGLESDYYSPHRQLVAQLSTTGTPTVAAGAMPIIQIFILPLV